MGVITKQELIDAQVDAQTLETVINGSASPGTLTSRLGTSLKTIAKILADIQAIDVDGILANALDDRIDDLETEVDQNFAISAKPLLYGGINGVNGVLSLPNCAITKSMFLVVEGDNLTKGQSLSATIPATVGFTYSDLYSATEKVGLLEYSNLAVGGSTLQSMIARGSGVDAAVAANIGYANYVLSIFIGGNDAAFPGLDVTYSGEATSWLTQLKAYIEARKAAGIQKVAIITLTPTNKELQPIDAETRKANNAAIKTLVGTGHVDLVIEFGDDPVLGNPYSINPLATASGPGSLYYNDWINFSPLGHYRAAMIAGPKYDALATNDEQENSVAMPTISPTPGHYATGQFISMASATSGAEIRYTTNGIKPTVSSTLYSSPIYVASTVNVRMIAFKSGMIQSIPTKSANYTFD